MSGLIEEGSIDIVPPEWIRIEYKDDKKRGFYNWSNGSGWIIYGKFLLDKNYTILVSLVIKKKILKILKP